MGMNGQSQSVQSVQPQRKGDGEKKKDGKEKESEEDATKNPWFNEEIANIVKLHRKTIRKFHRSKTKKAELKAVCKELEKKKRKLIKAAKQRHAMAMAMENSNPERKET